MIFSNQRRKLIYYLAGSVSLVTFILYLTALRNDFVEWDDNMYVFENPHIRSLNPSFFLWAFSTFYAGNWHPLTWISHALDYAVWGLNPLGHHLTNILLHAVNAFLVVVLVLRLMEARKPASSPASGGATGDQGLQAGKLTSSHYSPFIVAGVTGLLFGIHPIHVESVAWVAERKDLLCALFFLLSVMAYVKYAANIPQSAKRIEHRASNIYFAFTQRAMLFALCFFTLALMSKPMAVSLPVVLLILDWYPFKRISSFRTFRSALLEKLPFIILGIGSSFLTILAQKGAGAMGFMEFVPLSTRMLVAAKSLIAYLGKMLLPIHLTFFYPYPKDVSIVSANYFLPLILIIGITVASFLVIKRQRLWLSVWAYYMVTLIPVLGIVQVGTQEMADRYTYLPSIGPFLVAGLAAGLVLGKADAVGKQRTVLVRYGGVALLFLLLSLSSITFSQIGIWRDSITLWSSVIAKFPARAFFAYHNRGLAFNRMGQIDRAIEDYHKAISLNPRYADAHSNLGIALYQKGLVDQAIAEYQVAIQLDPRNANAHKNMAMTLYMSSRFAEALEHYLIVATLRPDDAGAHMDLGSAYGALGDYSRAIEHFQIALRVRPDFADAHYNLAMAYRMIGHTDKANDHYEEARRLNRR